ncbi:G-type lectin S-receptor-like serine/threonine-protein kinase At4g27290 [Aristolochia californica]|uniref:G-type lectin S-receptor-like serine/threonine-protein kinase At4g27290 n=1 Tax=Aristolochia californica TaxID=171875 RepID=UPI0035D9E3FA
MAWFLISVSLVVLLSYQSLLSDAADMLTTANSIRSNQTIISVGQKFALGFFTPGNSTNRYYIGIWYNEIPTRTFVWVANRDKPLTDSAGVLTISDDGSLVILDGKRNLVWSSNTSSVGNASAVLQDTGNLVLTADDGGILWQSFDYPTDTYIPGMKFRFNLRTRKNMQLQSWRSEDDPAPGNFTISIDPLLPLQLVMWSGSQRIWRSGRWTGDLYGGDLRTNRSYISYLTVVANETDISFTVSVSDTITSRLVVGPPGRIQQLSWLSITNRWEVAWWKPRSPCEFYSRCGSSGVCDEFHPSSVCRCLKGHRAKIQKDWDTGIYTAGCVREKPPNCDKGDGFYKMEKIKVPDLSTVVSNVTIDECQARCLANCSCTAYAYDDLTGVGCITWGSELADIEENYATGLDFYVRLPQSELGGSGSRKKRRLLAILLPLAAVLCFFLVLGGRYVSDANFMQRVDPWKTTKGVSGPGLAVGKVEIGLEDSNALGEGERTPDLPLITFASVVAATDNFSIANKLGQGGFGPVYKGRLPDGQEVAVKRLSKRSGQGLNEFRNELQVIAKLQHRNLVKLLGWCVHEEEKILVYEYMPNKSLDQFLFDPAQRSRLDWGTRFRITEGIAQGLLYLHRHSRLRIIHRDLKSGNILLDGDMNPKISDFGMARIFGGDQTEANTRRVVGTYGYMSPEYALDGNFSEKSDVFSFGVLMLEIVSGTKNTGFYQNTPSLLGHAWQLWSEGRSLELMVSSESHTAVRSQVERCVHVGLLCVQEDAGDRPTMSSVVIMLADEGMTLPPPKKCTFTNTRPCVSSSECGTDVSVNAMTISSITPR